MVSVRDAGDYILGLNGVRESLKKHIRSFRTRGRVFATLNLKEKRACLRLSEVDQKVFSIYRANIVYAVPNYYGKYGWTIFKIEQLDSVTVQDAILCAYEYIRSPI
jgi:hypothetical protein